MARQFLLVIIAIISLLSISSLCLATSNNSSSAEAFIKKTCKDATYVDLCLDTLLPDANRINGDPKKATRLAINRTITEVQSMYNELNNLSKPPKYWNREVNAFKRCSKLISDSLLDLDNAFNATYHLGGGNKDAKESKRLSMEANVKVVISASNTCIKHLQTSKAGRIQTTKVRDDMKPLVRLATNAINLIHRMEF